MKFWRQQPILRGYVSEIDQFLQEFDVRPDASSPSRRAEEAKYDLIFRKRDGMDTGSSKKIWEDF